MNHPMINKLLSKKRSLPVIALAGLLFLIAVVAISPGPKREAPSQHAQPANIITVQSQPVIPRTIGYGAVEPDVLWQAIAEVSGRIIYLHPELNDGDTLAAGTEVIRIDSRDYELALNQAQAELAAQQASLQQLHIEKKHTQSSLTIAKRSLDVAKSELARKKKLLKRGSISQTLVDQEERNSLAQQLEVQNLSSQLATYPSQLKVAESQLALTQAKVEEQQRNLERTHITLPFDARIGPVNIEQDSYLSKGTVLFEAYDLARAEIRAQLPMAKMRHLVETQSPIMHPGQLPMTHSMLKGLNLKAIARWTEINRKMQWTAQVDRIGNTLDPSTRALTVIVSVEQPFKQDSTTIKPPLFKGMYMEVELQGPAREMIAIPRHAIHYGNVYRVIDNTLQVQAVTVDFVQGDLAIIKSGLKAGDQIVVDDLVPAVSGQLLNPQNDPKLQQWIEQLARAELPLNGGKVSSNSAQEQ